MIRIDFWKWVGSHTWVRNRVWFGYMYRDWEEPARWARSNYKPIRYWPYNHVLRNLPHWWLMFCIKRGWE